MTDPYHAGAEAMRAAIMREILDDAENCEKIQTQFTQQQGAILRVAWLIAKHAAIPTSPEKDQP